jgi:hypothetical protein
MLHFGLMHESLGAAHSLRFLRALKHELAAYVPTLHAYWKSTGQTCRWSGRLSLESGIIGYESLLRWAGGATAIYEKETKGRKKS